MFISIEKHYSIYVCYLQNDIAACLTRGCKCPETAWPTEAKREQWEFREHDQGFISLGDIHNELAHRIWAQSNRRLVGKYAETAWKIIGKEMVGIKRNVTKD